MITSRFGNRTWASESMTTTVVPVLDSSRRYSSCTPGALTMTAAAPSRRTSRIVSSQSSAVPTAMAGGQVVVAAADDLRQERERLDLPEEVGRPPAALQGGRVGQALVEGLPAELGVGVAAKQNGGAVHYGRVRDGTVRKSSPGAHGQRRSAAGAGSGQAMSGAERVSGGAGSGCGAGPDGAAGFRVRREVSGRVRSSAPLLAGPSWPQGADGSGVGEADGNPFSFDVGRALFVTSDEWRVTSKPGIHSVTRRLVTRHLTLHGSARPCSIPAQDRPGVPRGTVRRVARTGLSEEGGFRHGREAAAGPGADVAPRETCRRRRRRVAGHAARSIRSRPTRTSPQGVRRGRDRPPVRQHQGARHLAAAGRPASRRPVPAHRRRAPAAGRPGGRAARGAGHVVNFDDQQVFEASLVENIQRSDLNPIEKAQGFKDYLDRYRVTQEQLADRLGMDRTSVSNLVNLLHLPEEVQAAVRLNQITPRPRQDAEGAAEPAAAGASCARKW